MIAIDLHVYRGGAQGKLTFTPFLCCGPHATVCIPLLFIGPTFTEEFYIDIGMWVLCSPPTDHVDWNIQRLDFSPIKPVDQLLEVSSGQACSAGREINAASVENQFHHVLHSVEGILS